MILLWALLRGRGKALLLGLYCYNWEDREALALAKEVLDWRFQLLLAGFEWLLLLFGDCAVLDFGFGQLWVDPQLIRIVDISLLPRFYLWMHKLTPHSVGAVQVLMVGLAELRFVVLRHMLLLLQLPYSVCEWALIVLISIYSYAIIEFAEPKQFPVSAHFSFILDNESDSYITISMSGGLLLDSPCWLVDGSSSVWLKKSSLLSNDNRSRHPFYPTFLLDWNSNYCLVRSTSSPVLKDPASKFIAPSRL